MVILTMVLFSVGGLSKYSKDLLRSLKGRSVGLVCTRRKKFMLCGAAFRKIISSHLQVLNRYGSIFALYIYVYLKRIIILNILINMNKPLGVLGFWGFGVLEL